LREIGTIDETASVDVRARELAAVGAPGVDDGGEIDAVDGAVLDHIRDAGPTVRSTFAAVGDVVEIGVGERAVADLTEVDDAVGVAVGGPFDAEVRVRIEWISQLCVAVVIPRVRRMAAVCSEVEGGCGSVGCRAPGGRNKPSPPPMLLKTKMFSAALVTVGR
jgi:hypothetical protein